LEDDVLLLAAQRKKKAKSFKDNRSSVETTGMYPFESVIDDIGILEGSKQYREKT
jgi:hypothetical protein